MKKRIRQYIGLLSAVLTYYAVHEGAHLIYALSNGVFRQINFMGIGMQIGIYEERMSDTGLGIFCSNVGDPFPAVLENCFTNVQESVYDKRA